MQHLTVLIAVVLVGGIVRPSPGAAQAAAAKPATAAAAAINEATMSRESKIALKKLEFAIKDLTPAQRAKALPILAEFGPRYEGIERRKRDEHEAELDRARRTQTPVDMKASEVREALRNRQKYQVEATYFDRIGTEVLTPEQRAKWDGYRLHFVAGFQLGMLGLTQAQNKELGALTEQVARDLKPRANEDAYQLFLRRLAEVKTRAAQKYFGDDQKKKLAEDRALAQELDRQMSALEAKEAAAATQPAA